MQIPAAVLLIGLWSEALTIISLDAGVYYHIGDIQHVPTV